MYRFIVCTRLDSIYMNALVYIYKVINKMHHSDAPLRELIKAGLDVFQGKLQEGYGPWKATLEGLHCLPM